MRADGPWNDENLRGNLPFRLFIQRAMPVLLVECDILRRAAERFGTGTLGIPDGRGFDFWRPDPVVVEVPDYRRICQIVVHGGRALPHTYEANSDYKG